MKTIIQSFVVSFIIHLIYIGGPLLAGYIKTSYYTPDFDNKWENVKPLHNEVAFGTSSSPLIFLITFFGVAVICGVIVLAYKKMLS